MKKTQEQLEKELRQFEDLQKKRHKELEERNKRYNTQGKLVALTITILFFLAYCSYVFKPIYDNYFK